MSDTSSGIFRRKQCENISQGSQFSDISNLKHSRFHRTCYTRRSQGYKYRTLATNTNITYKHSFPRDEDDMPVLDRKFAELHRAVNSKIDIQLDRTRRARLALMDKFDDIDKKIDSMLDLKQQLSDMQKELTVSQNTMIRVAEKLNEFDGVADDNSQVSTSINNPKSPFAPRKFRPLVKDKVLV